MSAALPAWSYLLFGVFEPFVCAAAAAMISIPGGEGFFTSMLFPEAVSRMSRSDLATAAMQSALCRMYASALLCFAVGQHFVWREWMSTNVASSTARVQGWLMLMLVPDLHHMIYAYGTFVVGPFGSMDASCVLHHAIQIVLLLGRLLLLGWLSEGTTALIVQGFRLRWRHAARLRAFAQSLHGGALRGKTVLVTGSARGLGSGVAAHLAAGHARLVLPLRTVPDTDAMRRQLAEAATAVRRANADTPSAVTPMTPSSVDLVALSCGLELGSFASIEQFAQALKAAGIVVDVLINNAGMVPIASGLTAEGFERAFGINFLGTVHLTQTLQAAGVLKPEATIINVSSEEHRLSSYADHSRLMPDAARALHLPHHGSVKGIPLGAVPPHSIAHAMERYAYSKLLLTTFSHQLDRRTPATVRDICPGPVASEIAREAPWPIGAITKYGMSLLFPSPAIAALPVVELAVTASGGSSKEVHYHMSEPRPAGAGASDDAVGAWLWEETQKLIAARSPPQ